MPKSLIIHPNEMRSKGFIPFSPIPINQYDGSMLGEIAAGKFTPDDLIRIQHDMQVIRSFETLLNEVKIKGQFGGIAYPHRGPAHLSMGQEAAAVGQAFLLGIEDHIYGSHRSHGEILAKGLSAIYKQSDTQLMDIMENYFEGQILKVVEKDSSGSSVRELAMDFLIYGALAEIFARDTGFNRGLGGSMHAFFPPFGIMPNNAIVGGSAGIAVGAALYKKVNQKPGIVICNIGDASAGCGPTWEALCFATMDQFKTLWEKHHRGGLPLILNFSNNFYGMGGQPVGETMGFKVLARMGAGLNPDQMHAERIDGYNPLAVIDAIRRKRVLLAKGDGPILLDTVTYRFSGHSPSDASSYREKSEIELWQSQDSLVSFRQDLVSNQICSPEILDGMKAQIDKAIFRAFRKSVDLHISPRASQKGIASPLEKVMFSNGYAESMDPSREPEVLQKKSENSRILQIAGRSRSAFDTQGEKWPKANCVSLRDALFEAIFDRFYLDATLIAYGEENRDWGGAFGVYRGLTEALPYHRLFNAPISEAAIVGSAVGYALEGGRVLVELMYCDFMGRAGDEIFNQMAKWQSMSGGLLRMPLVLRVSVGSKYGAQHSQDWTSLVAHIPGLKVVFPATPYDAKGLMNAALTGTDPVVFFESQRIYDEPEYFHPNGIPEEAYTIDLGEPNIKKAGVDITFLTVGATLYRALEAAQILEGQFGLSVEVIDARSLVPFNYALVLASLKKTHRILLASDACERGSFLHTLANTLSRLAFDSLDAPPVVIGSRNWITPADEVEEAFFPMPADFLDAVHEHILPLRGYQTQRECTSEELLRRARAGV